MDHAKTRIRINKNVGGDALDRPLQPIEKTKEPIRMDGGSCQPDLVAFLPLAGDGEKIKESIPSSWDRASVHRTLAFRWFKSGGVVAKKQIPSERMGELLARFVCIFAPAWEGQKLRFASVEPSAAALVRAAFRWFKSGAAKKEPRPEGLGSFLELLARFELATSSLPRMRSTG